MPKNLIASGPVMRPSPSATPSIRRPHPGAQQWNWRLGIEGNRAGGQESDLRPRARTTPGRSSGAPWSSCSRGTARSPWPGARRWPRSALPPGEASKTLRRGLTEWKQEQSFQMGFYLSELNIDSRDEGWCGRGVWLEPTRGGRRTRQPSSVDAAVPARGTMAGRDKVGADRILRVLFFRGPISPGVVSRNQMCRLCRIVIAYLCTDSAIPIVKERERVLPSFLSYSTTLLDV